MTTDTRHYPSFGDYVAIVLGIAVSTLLVGALTGMVVEACVRWIHT